MAGRSALGGFVEGLQGGMSFRDKRERDAKLNKALDYKIGEMDKAQRGADAAATAESGDAAILSNPAAGMVDPMRADLKSFGQSIKKGFSAFGSGVKGIFTRNRPTSVNPTALQAPEMNVNAQGVPDYAIENQGDFADGGRVRYANGGEVEPRRAGRYVDPETGVEFIDGVPQSAIPTSGGGAWEATKDVGRNVLGNTRRRVSEWAPAGIAADKAVLDAEGAADTGRAVRREMGEGLRGVGQVGMGLLEDTSVMPMVKGAGGFLGFGTSDEGEPRSAVAVPDDVAAAVPATDASPPPTAAQPGATEAPPSQPAAAGGGGVVPAGESAGTVGGQAIDDDSDPFDDEEFWSNVKDPGEIPRMTTRDWQKYRSEAVPGLMAQGMTAQQAHASISQMQQEGFTRFGSQAFNFLQAGRWREASGALTAAYQYFPNGADVKFGMHKGKDGQPALVAMATDEESGQGSGQPMLINAERLGMMLNQAQNPGAFTNWTKDWRREDFEKEIYENVTVPVNQANIDTARINARTAETRANTAADLSRRAAAGGGLKQSDMDRGLKAIEDILGPSAMMGEIPEGEMNRLGLIAAILYEQSPGNPTATIRGMLETYAQGGMAGVEAELGISGTP